MIKKIVFGLLVIALAGCATNPPPPPVNMKVDTFVSLGDVYAKAGRLAEAENYYQKALELDEQNLSLSYRLADLQVQQGKMAAASQTYQQILKVSPRNTKARYGLARVTLSSGDLKEALTHYEILLTANKGNYKALNGLGVLLDNLAQYGLAETCYKKGLVYSPHDFSLFNNLGISYALNGDLTQAQHYLNLSGESSQTSRSRDNLTLVNHSYEKIKNPAERQKELANAFLINKKNTTHPMLGRAVWDAKHWCASSKADHHNNSVQITT